MNSKKKEKILIVDDDVNFTAFLGELLSNRFSELLFANNGNDGLELGKDKDVGLIISDIRMPGLNGLSMSREILKDRPDANIILLTAFAEVDSYLDAMDLGAVDFFNKPVDIDAFKDIVNRLMN